jgi:hypothetical protein
VQLGTTDKYYYRRNSGIHTALYGAERFDQPIGNWNVSSVLRMDYKYINNLLYEAESTYKLIGKNREVGRVAIRHLRAPHIRL